MQSALDQPPAERAAFLNEACSGDAELRTEVQSLLDAGDDNFLEVPALNLAAQSLAEGKKDLIGAQVGPYRILEPIGAGGMGEVFLAQDGRLGRRIALKILPAEFAADAGRVRRFELEARAASALDHPNVLVIHDVGVHEGLPFIASEYLEGETLRDRLTAASLPIAKAVEFGIQIARALAAAHENGILHRDLKPENIFVTSEGRIKILDFGLAKLTASHPDATEAGMIMGSAGYLSPEQIRGQEAVRSSDIFSFGCVLYEMVTGRRAFSKNSNAETMAAILQEEPAALQNVPAGLIRVITHCLEKSPSDRFYSARDLAFALEGCLTPVTELAPVKRNRLGWAAAALVIIASALLMTRKTPTAPVVRFEIPIPGEPVTGSPALSISPDGKQIAFLAMGPKNKPILWTRAIDSTTPIPVAGSEDAQYPFWSADSRYLAYHAGDKLKALELATGGQRTICTIRGNVNGAWNADGVILLSTGGGPLMRVDSDGEHLGPLTKLDAAHGQRGHWWPCFLPDNRHFLYTVNGSTLESSGLVAGSLDSGESKRLVPGIVTNASYLPDGYLLYTRDGSLFARPFNASRLEFSGGEVPVMEKLKAYYGYMAFSVSRNGTLIYRTGAQGRFKLAWFDRAGKQLASGEQQKWASGILPLSPALSPDGNMLATVQYRATDGGYGIWLSALNRADVEYPVTTTRNAEYPVWSPDGRQIAYSASPNGGARDLFVKSIGGDDIGTLIYHSERDKWPLDWSSDGRYLVFSMNDDQRRSSLWVTSMVEKTMPKPIPGTPSDVKEARLSPDGKWIAYASEQSGTSIIFVQDFPKEESRIPISGRGASNPQWSRKENELFYLSGQNELVSVPVREDGSLIAGVPQVLFKTQIVGVNPYAIAPDGQRFLMQIPADNSAGAVIAVVLNWAGTLQRAP